jgi:hypothetical protein
MAVAGDRSTIAPKISDLEDACVEYATKLLIYFLHSVLRNYPTDVVALRSMCGEVAPRFESRRIAGVLIVNVIHNVGFAWVSGVIFPIISRWRHPSESIVGSQLAGLPRGWPR